MKKLEKERRFLIKLPLSQEAQEAIDLMGSAEITQTYLKNIGGEVERARKSSMKLWQQTFDHFYWTSKKHISSGIAEEDETDVTNDQYDDLLKRADESRLPIKKTRHFINSDMNAKVFELDIFHDHLEGYAILEIELEDLEEKIVFPTFLEIIKEITGDAAYSNFNLALKRELIS